MIEELGPKPGRFDMPDDEAAELVDNVARRVWGRTAFEEVAADIEVMEARVDLESGERATLRPMFPAPTAVVTGSRLRGTGEGAMSRRRWYTADALGADLTNRRHHVRAASDEEKARKITHPGDASLPACVRA